MTNSRAGLAAETATKELCSKMDAIPALREAFKHCAISWFGYGVSPCRSELQGGFSSEPDAWVVGETFKPPYPIASHASWGAGYPSTQVTRVIPAPTRGDMLELLEIKGCGPIEKRGYGGSQRWAVLVGDDDAGEAAWYRITSPDALAEACIAAAGGGA